MQELSTQKKEFCQYTGLLGIGMGVVCFFQQMYILGESLPYAILFSASAIAGIFAFSCLALCKKESGILLIVALALLFIRQVIIVWLFVKYQVMMVSLIQAAFFIYTLVILVLYFVNGYPKKLRAAATAKKEEDDFWNSSLPQ